MTDTATTPLAAPPTPLQTTISTLNTLVPLATEIVAMVGGVPVPVVAGLQVAQALLPVAESFILKIGQKNVTIDTSQANDTAAIVSALQKSVADGWPTLSFVPATTHPDTA